MLEERQLSILNDRKRVLILEAELNRGLIRAECAILRSRFAWLHAASGQLAAHRPWVAAGGIAAGTMAARHWRKLLRFIPAAVAAWRAFRYLRKSSRLEP